MRKQEQRLWDRMREKAKKLASVRLERVENLVNVGTPDVLALSRGIVTWCELKAIDEFPVRAATQVLGAKGLSVAQRNWHKDWFASGGNSVVLIGVGPNVILGISGFFGDSVNAMCREELELHTFAQNWADIFKYLGEKR